MEYAGKEWLKRAYCPAPSVLGEDVADLLGFLFRGLYHLSAKQLKQTDWTDARCIAITIPDHRMSTFDANQLTELVLLAHECCLRCELRGRSPGYLQLLFHRRERCGDITRRHPTIEEAVEQLRGQFSACSASPR